jgi:hypothetical protein
VIAHIMGLPIEESLVQLAPAGATVTAVMLTARAALARLRRRLRRVSRTSAGGLT